MRSRHFAFMLIMAVAGLFACSDDDKAPKMEPTVTTTTPTDVTLVSATAGGTISDNGNDNITASGVVYSSNVSLPTIEDNKVESTVKEGTFTVDLTGLSSGTTYHVRAYATNSVGTGYGEVMDFQTGNAAPTVSAVAIDGALEVNKTVSASYQFNDAEGDVEAGTTFKWYIASDAAGTDEAAIDGATSKTLLILDEYYEKYLRIGVTPAAATGTSPGAEVKSASSQVGAETVTFTYNGTTVTYGTIIGPSGKKWLDRNLGATSVASSITDYLNYGDLFQWGRLADGHQIITHNGITNADAVGENGTTDVKSTTPTPTSSAFITDTQSIGDWITPQTSNLWKVIDGVNVNNPCPDGWHVPSLAEWNAEGLTNIDDAYAKMKLPRTGYRYVDGSFNGIDLGGYYATSTSDETAIPYGSYRVRINATSYSSLSTYRASAYACRCVKD